MHVELSCCDDTPRSDLARQYRTKMSEMELKRIETNRLNEEFEAKIRKKEVGLLQTACYSDAEWDILWPQYL